MHLILFQIKLFYQSLVNQFTLFKIKILVFFLFHSFIGLIIFRRDTLLSIYIIKQDIRIYVPCSRPNGWTDWADIFCGHSWVAGGCYRLKKFKFFFQNFFFRKFFYPRALQLVDSIVRTMAN